MRLANVEGRAALVENGAFIDLELASRGSFSSDLPKVFERFSDVKAFAQGRMLIDLGPVADRRLGPPSPDPRQVFAIGLNYRDHAAGVGDRSAGSAPGLHQVSDLYRGP